MLKVLIVEDEALDTELLVGLVDWRELNMQIVGIAADGNEADELDRRHLPDIVLTDIIMPLKNGIELASAIRERRNNVHIIFISGHQDFTFAQTGIRIGIDEYLLKPLNTQQLKEALERTASICLKEKKHIFEEETFMQILRENMPRLRDMYLCQWVSGNSEPKDNIAEQLEFYSIGLLPKNLITIIFRPDIKQDAGSEYARRLRQYETHRIISDVFACAPNACVFMLGTQEEHVVLANNPGDDRCKELAELANCALRDIELFNGRSLTAGIGQLIDGYERVPDSYRSACLASEYRFFLGNGQVILFNDIAGQPDHWAPVADVPKETLARCVISGNTDLIIEPLTRLRAEFVRCQIAPDAARVHCIEITGAALSNIQQLIHPKLIDCDLNYQELFGLYTLDDMLRWLELQLRGLCEKIEACINDQQNAIAQAVQDIIKREISRELSVEIIADKLNLSRVYISRIFKKQTGQSINRYIIELRIDYARKLLRETKMKIFDIARNTGYENAAYFSSVFKNETGITPMEFRDIRQ